MISNFSVKKPYTVLAGVILVIFSGIFAFTMIITDLFNSISFPYVILLITCCFRIGSPVLFNNSTNECSGASSIFRYKLE